MALDLAEARSPVAEFFVKLCCWACFGAAGLLGGWTGQLLAQKRYPISMIERVNLTPEVRPGDAMLLAQHVDRHDQCDLIVKRTITTSTGQRFFVKQEFEEGFGPLGGDKYILPVEMPRTASHGPARMYSKAYSWCSWIDWIVPSEAESWTLDFTFSENTVVEPRPASFQHIGVKAARAAPPPRRSTPTESEAQ